MDCPLVALAIGIAFQDPVPFELDFVSLIVLIFITSLSKFIRLFLRTHTRLVGVPCTLLLLLLLPINTHNTCMDIVLCIFVRWIVSYYARECMNATAINSTIVHGYAFLSTHIENEI